jgi:hypothetical protein
VAGFCEHGNGPSGSISVVNVERDQQEEYGVDGEY